ncbi:recombinase family protein [Streptomyces sp. A3M-1-3]|uniref:recombinase family protein n=1 Tax=Streptomyces sp. A3M-1-3 TaxID=2962044 RepID=UPI0020B78A89|nr:recombinase family protein [Streptomyces sp. A3M-1-3]MCP3819629.1 recombinase family protein [Streptomyces sp. A3M-1-3]
MRDKHQANRTAGVNHGGPRAFGYQAVKPKAKGQDPEVPQVDGTEAELIRMAADAVLAHDADPDKGLTPAGICRAWNAEDALTPRGTPCAVPSLRKTLLSARIAGLVEHRGEVVGPAQWDAILDHDVWLAVRNVLTDPARSSHLSAGHDGKSVRYLGSGLYRCHCGAVIRPGGAHAGAPQQYRCTERAHLIRQAAPVDDFVERVIIARLCREDAHVLFAPPAPATAGADLDALEGRHKALTARLEGLAEAFAGDDDADPVEYREAARRIKQKLAAVEQEITDAATAAAAAAAPGPLDEVDLPELVRRHAEDTDEALAWWRARYGLAIRRRIVAALVSVTLLPARTGRPAGWRPGQSYFDPESVDIDWVRR